jgi:hypothetical protein
MFIETGDTEQAEVLSDMAVERGISFRSFKRSVTVQSTS